LSLGLGEGNLRALTATEQLELAQTIEESK
jgi:hypothetical protein